METVPLVVNDQVAQIRSNLWNALWYFREYDMKNRREDQVLAPRRLWVDALCINQADIQERNYQVRLMSRIYTQAREVVVWLGVGGDPAESAVMDSAMRILQSHQRPLDLDKAERDALTLFFRLNYWNRRWIVQEIGLAKQSIIHYGFNSVDWSCISYLRESLEGQTNMRPMPSISVITSSLAFRLDGLRKAWQERRTCLSKLLIACQLCKCSEPRDKDPNSLRIA
jgi:hypothetical protein